LAPEYLDPSVMNANGDGGWYRNGSLCPGVFESRAYPYFGYAASNEHEQVTNMFAADLALNQISEGLWADADAERGQSIGVDVTDGGIDIYAYAQERIQNKRGT